MKQMKYKIRQLPSFLLQFAKETIEIPESYPLALKGTELFENMNTLVFINGNKDVVFEGHHQNKFKAKLNLTAFSAFNEDKDMFCVVRDITPKTKLKFFDKIFKVIENKNLKCGFELITEREHIPLYILSNDESYTYTSNALLFDARHIRAISSNLMPEGYWD